MAIYCARESESSELSSRYRYEIVFAANIRSFDLFDIDSEPAKDWKIIINVRLYRLEHLNLSETIFLPHFDFPRHIYSEFYDISM